MTSILAELSLDYSWRGFALLTCASAILSALVIYILRRAQSAGGTERRRWISAGGIVLGSGIWAIYFLDAAIHRPDGAAGLDVKLLALALAASITLASAGMWQAVAGPALWRFFIGGGLFGTAIAATSQIIMIASRAPSEPPWSIGFVFAVTALVMALASAALVAAEDEATKREPISPPLCCCCLRSSRISLPKWG
jgi:NO-binding membrane sensor protein with MHYT domain